MFKLTASAAAQVSALAAESGESDPVLRVAARRMADGGIDYIMGFDEHKEGDAAVESEGVMVVLAPDQQELLANTTLDYVELDEGGKNFVFIDPSNPRHRSDGGAEL